MNIVLWRFSDLQARGIVGSRPQLKNLQVKNGFPEGQMLGDNTRAWRASDIEDWIAARPVENTRPLQGAAKARRERRLQSRAVQDGGVHTHKRKSPRRAAAAEPTTSPAAPPTPTRRARASTTRNSKRARIARSAHQPAHPKADTVQSSDLHHPPPEP